MYIPLYITHYFSPAASKILSLAFISLNMVCLGVAFFGFILVWIYCASSVSTYKFFTKFQKFSEITASNIFFCLFLLLFSFRDSNFPYTGLWCITGLWDSISLQFFSTRFLVRQFLLIYISVQWVFLLPYLILCWNHSIWKL